MTSGEQRHRHCSEDEKERVVCFRFWGQTYSVLCKASYQRYGSVSGN